MLFFAGIVKIFDNVKSCRRDHAQYLCITVIREIAQISPRVMSSQYGGGCQVQWRVPSTVEGYLAVQWGAIMKYSGGCGVRWRAI